MKIFKRKIKKELVSASYKDEILTLLYSNGETEQFQGSSTVWYKMPYMIRQGTMMEYWLSQIYKYCTYWGGDYPYAHLKNINK
jgi:hypothetical protein